MKAIIWRRGSTDRQEIESQDKELTELAISEGFKEEDSTERTCQYGLYV